MDALYATSGETLDLSTYILGTDSPVVLLGGDDGFVLQHNRGTSSAGKVLAFEAGADGAALDECGVNTVLSAVISPCIVIGAEV
jgi:hypothetical protein